MKIKINILGKNILKKKNNEKQRNGKRKGKLIKFKTNNDSNIYEGCDKKIRTGAKEFELKLLKNDVNIVKEKNTDENTTKKIKRQGVKVLSSMILLLTLTITIGINSKTQKENSSQIDSKTDTTIAVSSSIDSMDTEDTPVASIVEEEEEIEEVVVVTPKVEETLSFCVPLDGEILKMYSTDKVIYSKTLSQWKTHDGLDISASSTAEVKAIEKGVVEDIYYDSFYGMTIVIEHINGYRSQYSNLEENVYVSIGESVIKGQKIGKVGNTSVGEYLDEIHLHFMLYLNNVSIDPTYIYS